MNQKCPICDAETLTKMELREDATYCECPRCVRYALTGTARSLFASSSKTARAKLSYIVNRMTRGTAWPKLNSEIIQSILREPIELPSPTEQLDNLISWLGVQGSPGTRAIAGSSAVSAVGALDFSGFAFIADEALKRGLIDCRVQVVKPLGSSNDDYLVTPMLLTLAGWDRLEDLRRIRVDSRIAFMAMPFGQPELDEIYFGHFQAAVRVTGFTLKRLDEDQPAGLIDDRLRVEIRQCRFLIADLTHRNPGAYWEAGYAEGLGKPVIYTCKKSVFDDRSQGTHFDTNHHLTVTWDAAAPAAAMSKLKATIRATLPEDSVLTD